MLQNIMCYIKNVIYTLQLLLPINTRLDRLSKLSLKEKALCFSVSEQLNIAPFLIYLRWNV